MPFRNRVRLAGLLLPILALSSLTPRTQAQNTLAGAGKCARESQWITPCDVSLPIRVELAPLNEARPGQTTEFRVDVQSSLDPDLVRSSWIEYELPPRLRRTGSLLENREQLGRAATGHSTLSVIVPDGQRYEVRARYVVQLTDGRTIAQTAVRHINLGNQPPEGMTERIIDSRGRGILVFRGVAVRD